MGELYEKIYNKKDVTIPSEFLEDFLSDVDADFLKVFIYYLWKGNSVSIDEVCDYLSLTENDVIRAIKFWIKKGILPKDLLEDKKKINSIISINNSEKTYQNENKKNFEDVSKEFLFVAEKLLPNTISSVQYDTFRYFYEELDMSIELIEYLIEYCVSLGPGKTGSRYMKSVAMDWYENGVKTIDDVKKNQQIYSLKKLKNNNKNKYTIDINKKIQSDDLDAKLKKRMMDKEWSFK